MNQKDNFCSMFQRISIKTKKLGKLCKYHKRAAQIYDSENIIKNFCPHAFYTAYPHCLALLYNGRFAKNKIYLHCPCNDGIVFEARHYPAWNIALSLIYKFLKWLTEKISFPLDIEDWHIKLTVVKNKGGCPQNYQVGQIYEFNIRRLEELCPASFYQLYPFFISGDNKKVLHCPDHQGMSYLIKKEN